VHCENPKICNRPTSVADANNNITTYTYDPNHGGVLTETMPMVGGVAPQKRYEYAQRYAWFKNSSGSYVQAATPVWVKTRERFCKTTAASGASCAGRSADEVVTDYDYGPNSGPNPLLVRGVVVTATNSTGALETKRTCFSYDANGRKISETNAAANLSSCP
jgi:YD repeat-containing protein